MKKIMLFLIIATLVVPAIAGPTTVLDFDDITTADEAYFTNYGGFTWGNAGVVSVDWWENTYGGAGDFYEHSATSGKYAFASNRGDVASTVISSSAEFNFLGAYFSPASDNDCTIFVKGFLGGVQQGETLTINLSGATAVWVDCDFGYIDELIFTPDPLIQGNVPSYFAMDDFTYVVPVPGAVLLGGIGVGLVGWFRRRHSL